MADPVASESGNSEDNRSEMNTLYRVGHFCILGQAMHVRNLFPDIEQELGARGDKVLASVREALRNSTIETREDLLRRNSAHPTTDKDADDEDEDDDDDTVKTSAELSLIDHDWSHAPAGYTSNYDDDQWEDMNNCCCRCGSCFSALYSLLVLCWVCVRCECGFGGKSRYTLDDDEDDDDDDSEMTGEGGGGGAHVRTFDPNRSKDLGMALMALAKAHQGAMSASVTTHPTAATNEVPSADRQVWNAIEKMMARLPPTPFLDPRSYHEMVLMYRNDPDTYNRPWIPIESLVELKQVHGALVIVEGWSTTKTDLMQVNTGTVAVPIMERLATGKPLRDDDLYYVYRMAQNSLASEGWATTEARRYLNTRNGAYFPGWRRVVQFPKRTVFAFGRLSQVNTDEGWILLQGLRTGKAPSGFNVYPKFPGSAFGQVSDVFHMFTSHSYSSPGKTNVKLVPQGTDKKAYQFFRVWYQRAPAK